MYKLHVFICTAAPDTEGKCGNKGSNKLLLALRKKCNLKQWGPDVRINVSGCLGYCQRGTVAVIYPYGKWFFNLKEEDVDILYNEIEELMVKS